jgi:hypothetical protein
MKQARTYLAVLLGHWLSCFLGTGGVFLTSKQQMDDVSHAEWCEGLTRVTGDNVCLLYGMETIFVALGLGSEKMFNPGQETIVFALGLGSPETMFTFFFHGGWFGGLFYCRLALFWRLGWGRSRG